MTAAHGSMVGLRALMYNGIWLPPSGSDLTTGRATMLSNGDTQEREEGEDDISG